MHSLFTAEKKANILATTVIDLFSLAYFKIDCKFVSFLCTDH